jgi:hypothetical protein
MLNLATAFLEHSGEPASGWVDLCIEFVDQLIRWTESHGLKVEPITIEPVDEDILHSPVGEGWSLHQVALCGGRVHDMYVEKPLRLSDYLQVMFPDQRVKVEYPDRDVAGIGDLINSVAVYDIWKNGVLELRVDTDDIQAVA